MPVEVEHYDDHKDASRRMTAREWLGQVRRIDKRVDVLLEQVQRMRTLLTRCTQQSGESSGGGKRDWTETVARLLELENELKAEIDRLVNIRRQVRTAIDQLPNADVRLLMEKRYINGWSWRRIASGLNYSEDWMWKEHRKALQMINVPENTVGDESVQ